LEATRRASNSDGRRSVGEASYYLARALNVRGGGDGDSEGSAPSDEVQKVAEEDDEDDDVVLASASDEDESVDNDSAPPDTTNDKNAMKELRKQWSSIPAVPSIEYPPTPDSMMMGEADTLGGLENDTQQQQSTTPKKAIIIMDGFSPYHGQYLAHMAHRIYGAAVIFILSDFMARYLYQVQQSTDHLSSRMPDLDNGNEVEAWLSELPSELQICGIYCESDSGLDDAEKLGVALGLYPRCHDGINEARRDKYLMNEMVGKVGRLDVVQQKSCGTLVEAEEFAIRLGLGEETASDSGNGNDGESSPLVVVKPLRGVASDDVHLCSDLPSLREAFSKILQSPIFGSSVAAKHEQVLIQEFATGTEYAIDVVCRDGERKAAALWRYDKRAVNGAPFVYHATELVPARKNDDDDGKEGETAVEEAVCNYVFGALDALGIRWGLSHVEVIAETSPTTGKIRVRLVEVNCRQHNTDFIPLTNACVGYNALDMVLAAHLGNLDGGSDEDEGLPWDAVPILPATRAHGAIVHFVSHVEGRISRIRFDILEEMEDLPSVMDMHVYPQFMEVGNPIGKTVDIRTDTGWAHLMNDDEEEFRSDYARMVELMKDMFEVEEEMEEGGSSQ